MISQSNARLTGYLSLAVILLAAGWGALAIFREALHPDRILYVRFKDLGTLKTQDPVVQRGVPIGEVKRISLQNGEALAEIELYSNDFIAADSRIVNFNYSLMGARKIMLVPGTSTLPIDERDTLTGLFSSGVAESIHHVGEILSRLSNLRTQVDQLFSGPHAPFSPEFLGHVEKNLQAVDALAQKLDASKTSLQSGLAALSQTGNGMRTGIKNLKLDSAEKELGVAFIAVESAQKNVAALLTLAENVLASANDSSGPGRRLLEDRRLYEDLKNSVAVLHGALATLQSKGLRDVVRWRNIHFFHPKPE